MQRKKAEKNVLLFIVEGENDVAALAAPLENLHKAYSAEGEIKFGFTRGDITTKKAMTFKGLRDKIAKYIRDYCVDENINTADICEIVLLLDMDGAYIPDDAIVQDDTYIEDPFYGESSISYFDPEKVRTPHICKRHNLDILIEVKDVMGGKPFSVYYVSCNFEHVASHNANMTDREKSRAADVFAHRFAEDADSFCSFFRAPSLTLGKTFQESWDAIRRGLNSLHRHSNLNIFFDKNYPDA